jgi:hypothetical protein
MPRSTFLGGGEQSIACLRSCLVWVGAYHYQSLALPIHKLTSHLTLKLTTHTLPYPKTHQKTYNPQRMQQIYIYNLDKITRIPVVAK